MTTTVYIVDDDPSAREAVAAIVSSMEVEARAFDSAEEFLEAYDPATPGCLISDVRMPGISGMDLVEQLRASSCFLPIILITAYADVPLAVRAMQQGAFTLLEKPTRNHELWEAIRRAIDADAARRRRLSDERARGERLSGLTAEERQTLQLILSGKSNKAIAAELDISLRTVGARRHSIFEKLGVRSVAELVRIVLETNRAAGDGTGEAAT